MKIYTSYFAKTKELEELGIFPVSIAYKTPLFFKNPSFGGSCGPTASILYEYKKGVDRCIYQSGAIDCLNAINTNDPRPKRAVALGHTTKNRLKSRLRQTEIRRKTAYLRERSPCPRIWKLSIFRFENKSKNSFTP